MGWDSDVEGISVVKSAGDEGLDDSYSGVQRDPFKDLA